MKLIRIYIALLFAFTAVLYLSTAFLTLEFSPIQWEREVRSVFVFIEFAIILLSFPVAGLIEMEIK